MLSVYPPLSIFMKQCMYIMAPEPISTAYFIIPFHQSVVVYPPIVARQRLSKSPSIVARQRVGKTNTHLTEELLD
jgi:hypothetical protein